MMHPTPSCVGAVVSGGFLSFLTILSIAQGPVYEALLKKDPQAAEEYQALRAQMDPPAQAAKARARPPVVKASPVVDHPDNLVNIARLRAEAGGAEAGDPRAVAIAAREIDDHMAAMKGKEMPNALAVWDHLHTCEICGPIILSHFKAHTDAVAALPRAIVLFAYDSDAVPPANYAEGGPMFRFAQRMAQDPDWKLLILGRASRIGDLEYNRGLSQRRAQAIREVFEGTFGITYDRLLDLALGWEPPQIDGWLADKYGLKKLFDEVGKLQVNQSALLVLYKDDRPRKASYDAMPN